MEDTNGNSPVFKKVDRAVFQQIDKFKTTPNYTMVQDYYNGLEEEQQRIFKGLVLLGTFLIPALLIAFLYWQNTEFKAEYDLRVSIAKKAQEILAQNRGIRDVSPNILSDDPIDSESIMTSKLSELLSASNIDLSKIQVSGFVTEMISNTISKAEADFAFANTTTEELMNVFTSMIQREKFRIESVEISKTPETNLLTGQFHAIHFSSVDPNAEEE